ncbi:MAG: hypothetical protein ACE5HY_04565 [Candidatus Hydrothermarchaeales archaeon]
MEDIVSLSMAGLYSLLILNLTFLFLIGIRVHNIKTKIISVEETMAKQVKTLKERIELLEKALNL